MSAMTGLTLPVRAQRSGAEGGGAVRCHRRPHSPTCVRTANSRRWQAAARRVRAVRAPRPPRRQRVRPQSVGASRGTGELAATPRPPPAQPPPAAQPRRAAARDGPAPWPRGATPRGLDMLIGRLSSLVSSRLSPHSSLLTPLALARFLCSEGKTFDPDWKRSDPVTHVVAILGWTLPSWTPAPSFGGESLFGLFNKSIAENLAHFPQGPAADDKFWLARAGTAPRCLPGDLLSPGCGRGRTRTRVLQRRLSLTRSFTSPAV